jgi:type I restriction enzyme S subunit
VESFVKGAGLPRLSIQNLLKIVGVFPPIAEQRQIVDRLNIILGQMASLLTSALEAIELLKERRTALISAFVTGKIDVRGLVFSDGK